MESLTPIRLGDAAPGPLIARRATLALLAAACLPFTAGLAAGTSPAAPDWAAIERRAAGGTVYFNAWGGDESINRYIEWIGARVHADLGITLVHVKVTDIAEAVTRILAEAAAGRSSGGSADLLWLNGASFASLRHARLLYGPWADTVPNARWIDVRGNPTTAIDFGLPTKGFELPWGSARFTFFLDAAQITEPPGDVAELLAWIRAHPGRFSYPRPPNFTGTSFLKQLLLMLNPGVQDFSRPVGANFERLTQPLWRWLDAAKPALWRHGQLYPPSGPAQRELLASGELAWMMAFNPNEAERAVLMGELPRTVRTARLAGPVLANSHFLAIPANARNPDGARVVANFMLSPQAQARKARIDIWGDPTVLAVDSLPPAEQALFTQTPAMARPAIDAPLVPDFDASWVAALESAWQRRYGV